MSKWTKGRRLSLREVAETLGVHYATVARWVKSPGVQGRILCTTLIGGRRWVLESDLEQFIAPRSIDPKDLEGEKQSESVDASVTSSQSQ